MVPREALQEIGQQVGTVEESPFDRNIVDQIFDTDTSVAFEAKDEATFNDTNINAREAGLMEGRTGEFLVGEENFLTKYATENGERPVDVTLMDSGSQLATNLAEGTEAIINAATDDPVGLASSVGAGLLDTATDLDTYTGLVISDSKGDGSDQQTVAELQGDTQAAKQAGADAILDTIGEYAIPGVGKAAKNATQEVAGEAAEQATKNQPLTKEYFEEVYGKDAVTQGGGNYSETRHRIDQNIQETKKGNASSGFKDSSVVTSEKTKGGDSTARVDPKSLISRQGKNEMSSSQIKKLRRNMRENGYDESKPVEVADVDGRMIIIDGHHRTQGAIGAKIKEIPANITKTTKEQGDLLLKEAAEARLY